MEFTVADLDAKASGSCVQSENVLPVIHSNIDVIITSAATRGVPVMAVLSGLG